MSDPTEATTGRPRGEAAWIAHRDAVQARNAQAKRLGKARHDEWERTRDKVRRGRAARDEQRPEVARDEQRPEVARETP